MKKKKLQPVWSSKEIEILRASAKSHRFGVLVIAAFIRLGEHGTKTEQKIVKRVLQSALSDSEFDKFQQFLSNIM
jgi:hypothetical protein